MTVLRRFFNSLAVAILVPGLFCVTPAAAERVALVIGNAAYEHAAELANPRNDATAVSTMLQKLGFDVVSAVDTNHRDLRSAMNTFARKLPGSKVALFYYAGHGLQVDGQNYLVPVDARLDREVDLHFEAIPISLVMRQMERSQRTNLVFLDACRNNPLTRNLARAMGTRSAGTIGQGLAKIRTAVGTLIAYATEPGNVAYDGTSEHSPFTRALLDHLDTPGMDIADLMRNVRRQVIKETDGQQVPWSHSSLTSSFKFLKNRTPDPKEIAVAEHSANETVYWQAISASENHQAFENYLKLYPKGQFVFLARQRVAMLKKQKKVREAQHQKQEAERARREAALKAQFAETQRRLEEERLARLKREKDFEALQQQVQKLAHLRTNENAPADPALTRRETNPDNSADNDVPLTEVDQIRRVQTELKRVGCYTGRVDGKWGSGSRIALRRFSRVIKKSKLKLPNEDALLAVQSIEGRVCKIDRKKPAATTVKKRKPATDTKSGTKQTRKTKKKAKAKPKTKQKTASTKTKKRRKSQCRSKSSCMAICKRQSSYPLYCQVSCSNDNKMKTFGYC